MSEPRWPTRERFPDGAEPISDRRRRRIERLIDDPSLWRTLHSDLRLRPAISRLLRAYRAELLRQLRLELQRVLPDSRTAAL